MLAGAGCETYGRADWKSRVGHYTYDDAVKELGPPEAKETTSDGTLVAQWVTSYGQAYGTSSFGGWRGRGRIDWNTSPNGYLQLQFGPDKQLATWKRLMK
jgi:hypothetical protein